MSAGMSDPAAPQGEDPRVEEAIASYRVEAENICTYHRGAKLAVCLCRPIQEALYDATVPLRRENAKLRESNTALNRRATRAEAIVAQRVEEQERKGKSLGRSLANAGYYLLKAENAKLREALAKIRDGVWDGQWASTVARAALDPSSTGTR